VAVRVTITDNPDVTQTALDPPDAGVPLNTAEPAPKRRRRWPWLVGALVFALAGTTTGLLVAAARYQPLGAGGLGYGVLRHPDGTLAYGHDIANVFGEERVLPPPAVGDVLLIDFGVTNTGSRSVRIQAIRPIANPFNAADRSLPPRMNSLPSGLGQRFKPFEPFTLGPNQERDFEVGAEYVSCPGDQSLHRSLHGSTMEFTGAQVVYSFAGFRHTVTIPLTMAVGVRDYPFCE